MNKALACHTARHRRQGLELRQDQEGFFILGKIQTSAPIP